MALAILMIPTVARTSEEVLKLIPQDLREAGTALGGTQWRTVAMIVIPAARSGLNHRSNPWALLASLVKLRHCF